jgi:hypothetical protein
MLSDYEMEGVLFAMKKIVIAIFLVAVLVTDVNANTGVFYGSGQTIYLGKSEQVQLVSEDVTIVASCGWNAMMDAVEYRCKFVLKNLTAKPSKIQVGFPLDSQFFRTEEIHSSDATDLVFKYHFIARDDKTTYHVRFVPNDSEEKFSQLFVWDMAFGAAETKVLHVGYRMPMSRALSGTGKKFSPGYEKKWHATLDTGVVGHFHYITETGKSWAGPIESATFRVETRELEDCLKRRPLMEAEASEPRPAPVEEQTERLADGSERPYASTFPNKAWAVYQVVLPDGGMREGGTTTWKYRPYKAGKPLDFCYWSVPFPRAAADCDSWLQHVLGPKPSKSDLAELREIMAAFYGIVPQSASAKKFVGQQIWYHPKKGLQEAELNEEQREVLSRLDVIAKGPTSTPAGR